MNILLSLLLPAALAIMPLQLSSASRIPAPGHGAKPVDAVPAKAMPADAAPPRVPLSRLAPKADPEVLKLALDAMHCAQASGVATQAQRLAVIDYSRPSLKPRLWVFDLAARKLLFHEVVAHGQGSGGNFATDFSNREGSHQSSLGLFLTTNTYHGRNGYSLRLDGLEPGINDNAMSRAIVMHGAPYVNPVAGKAMGRLGRSWGCPAVRTKVARPMLDLLKQGQFVFSYYPDPEWLRSSQMLNCNLQTAKTAARNSH